MFISNMFIIHACLPSPHLITVPLLFLWSIVCAFVDTDDSNRVSMVRALIHLCFILYFWCVKIPRLDHHIAAWAPRDSFTNPLSTACVRVQAFRTAVWLVHDLFLFKLSSRFWSKRSLAIVTVFFYLHTNISATGRRVCWLHLPRPCCSPLSISSSQTQTSIKVSFKVSKVECLKTVYFFFFKCFTSVLCSSIIAIQIKLPSSDTIFRWDAKRLPGPYSFYTPARVCVLTGSATSMLGQSSRKRPLAQHRPMWAVESEYLCSLTYICAASLTTVGVCVLWNSVKSRFIVWISFVFIL